MCNSKSAPTVSPKTESDSSPTIEIGSITEMNDHSIHLPTVFGCVTIAATILVIGLICIFARRYKRIFFQDQQWQATTTATADMAGGTGRQREEDRNLQEQIGGQIFRYHPAAERMVPVGTWDENLDTIGAGAPIAIQGIGRTATCGKASRHRGIGMPIPKPSVQVVALPTPTTGGDRQLQWFPSHTNLPQLLEQEADNRIVDLDSMEERYRTHQGRVDRLEREIARLKKRVDPSPPHTPSNNDPPQTKQGETTATQRKPAGTRAQPTKPAGGQARSGSISSRQARSDHNNGGDNSTRSHLFIDPAKCPKSARTNSFDTQPHPNRRYTDDHGGRYTNRTTIVAQQGVNSETRSIAQQGIYSTDSNAGRDGFAKSKFQVVVFLIR